MTDQSYAERNKDFCTSSKLKAFQKCPFCFKLECIDMIPNPRAEERDYFTTGTAFDYVAEQGGKLDKYEQQYPIIRKGTKQYDRAVAEGVTPITGTIDRDVRAMVHEFKENPLFVPKIKKEKLIMEFGGLKLKAELDHCDNKNKIIYDLKSTANIMNFDPSFHVFQQSFYHWMKEELTGERYRVRLLVADKRPSFSRSRVYEYTEPVLMQARGLIFPLLEKYKQAHDLGIFLPPEDERECETHDYYGYESHGRLSRVLYF